MRGALTGLRLIEMGQLIAGPFCGQMMADHGAEVIKIEAPGEGDPMRGWGQKAPVWWPVIARNKRCITLNLRDRRGQEIARQLISKADFLLENFRPGTLEKWGLDYLKLAAENPGLIMIRVSGFGQTGPYAGRAGYGLVGEAMGGLRNLTGDPDRPPARVGVSIGDALAATHACMGALMALHARHASGRGQVVDAALYESVLAMMESLIPEYSVAGHIRERSGSILPGIAPSNAYPAKDGDVVIGANQDTVFARLAEAMGRPELAQDPRYRDHHARGQRQAELDAIIADWTRGQDSAALLEVLETHGVPASKIYKARDMLADPHFAARDAVVSLPHPEFGTIAMQNVVPKLSATPGEIRWAGPALGTDNERVYGELLGLSSARMRELAEDGVI